MTFTPTSVGAKAASLDITSNASDVNVPMTGTGIPAEMSATEGTIGTVIIIDGSNFGTKKGKVLIGGLKQKVDIWSETSITMIVNKYNDLLIDTPYDVSIQPKEPKGAPPIAPAGTFTLRKPEINEDTSDDTGARGADATIKGLWFGTKKGKVYVGEQKCKVTSWTMDTTTGESTIVFVVHNKIVAGSYPLQIENKIGRSVSTTLFTVP